LLDYLERPNGVHEQLTEIYDHQVKVMYKQKRNLEAKESLTEEERVYLRTLTRHHSHELGIAAQKSVGLEIYDYNSNASAHLDQLKTLEDALGGLSPNLSLEEALSDADAKAILEAGCATLVQFVDLRRYRDRGIAPTAYDPLRNRETDRGNQPHFEKNKTVNDTYHVPQPEDAIAQRIEMFMKQQKLGDIQALLVEAIMDRNNAVTFWSEVKSRLRGSVKRVVNELDENS